MKPLFVFTADLHLEDGAWSTRPTIYGDAYYSFTQIIDYCLTHKLPLILGGDVLEKKSNSARPIAQLCYGLSRMQAADLRVFYIQGNHEFDRNAPWLSVHRHPEHLHGKLIPINGAWVYGLDWQPRGDIQVALKEVPKETDILITHQVWENFMNGVGRTECCISDVHNVTTILAGDFHVTTSTEALNADSRKTEMWSPGSICMQDLSEDPAKFFFVVCAKPDGGFQVERKALETRPFAKYVVEDQEYLDTLCAGGLIADIEALNSRLSQAAKEHKIDKAIVRIKFNKQLPDAFLRLSTAVGDSCHLFCEAIVDKHVVANKASNRSGAKNDLLSALSDLLGEDSDEYKLAAALVAAEEPAKEFDVVFNRFTSEEPDDAVVATGSEELGASSAADM